MSHFFLFPPATVCSCGVYSEVVQVLVYDQERVPGTVQGSGLDPGHLEGSPGQEADRGQAFTDHKSLMTEDCISEISYIV